MHIPWKKTTNLFPLQFGFRQKQSTTYALIYLTENNRKQFDEGNYDCSIFVDFQEAFDTVNHNVLLKKTSNITVFEEFFINGLHLILKIENNCLTAILPTLNVGCPKAPY